MTRDFRAEWRHFAMSRLPERQAHDADQAPLRRLESGDLDTYLNAHGENCRGVLGNMAPVTNRDGIRIVSEQLYAVVKKVTHHVVNE